MEKITNKIAALSDDDVPFTSLEFFPPKTSAGLQNLQDRLLRMSQVIQPLFINVSWGAGGSTSSKSLGLAEFTQRHLGLTTCLHLTCTNMSRQLIDNALRRAREIGIRNILALRGDPPREKEYGTANHAAADDPDGQGVEFTWAIDLVSYIRREYGDWFCIGVAAYPDGHADQSHPDDQSVEHDLPYLVDKVRAGADFVMTQLFFDVESYNHFEHRLRSHESGVFKTIPIIPALMPIQNYQIIRRITALSHAKLPQDLLDRLNKVKGNDEQVKRIGVDILCEIIEALRSTDVIGKRGFHFYTLNLEKAVSNIIERCGLLPSRLNQVVTKQESLLQNVDHETVKEVEVTVDASASHSYVLDISKGQGGVNREMIWDDYPNGRWGDARSPAFGEVDGYGISKYVPALETIKSWGEPLTTEDISLIFQRHILGQIGALPWSEEELNLETSSIRDCLFKLNGKGWWTVASQPAVNGLKSSHPVFGWGPSNGFVFQKPFIEFFLSSHQWELLRARLDECIEITYFAANKAEQFQASDPKAINPVTWGSFAGKETGGGGKRLPPITFENRIITSTIIEAESFLAWREEAFETWHKWQRIYPPLSPTAKLLGRMREDVWLVSIVHHEFMRADALWDLLLEAAS